MIKILIAAGHKNLDTAGRGWCFGGFRAVGGGTVSVSALDAYNGGDHDLLGRCLEALRQAGLDAWWNSRGDGLAVRHSIPKPGSV